MGHHKHLTLREREDIMVMWRENKGVTQIAEAIGRDKSTVSRELHRNMSAASTPHPCYRASTAQARYEQRRKSCARPRILDDPETFELVRSKFLEEQWSPEQIEGRLALELGSSPVSDTTIYRGIHEGRFDGCIGGKKAARRLRHRGKRRKRAGSEERRGKIVVGNTIDERPAAADERARLGDWEADTVAGRQGGACLATFTDRKSGYLEGGKAAAKTADEVNAVAIASLAGHPLHSITPDRGKEFAKHAEVTEALHVEFYFALPHHPWQRGTNENTNGLLREYFPKGEPIDGFSDEEVRMVYDKLNQRPRKRLGYRTPHEVHYSTTLQLI